MMLTATFRRDSATLVAYLRGQIVFGHEVDSIARQASSLALHHRNLILHLGDVGEVRGSDVGPLWLQYMQAKAMGWDIKLVEIPTHLRQLMRDTRIDAMFEIYETEQEAAASFSLSRSAIAGDSSAA